MRSIGFGLDRIAMWAVDRPRVATVMFVLVVAAAAFGATRLSFDEDLRNIFASEAGAYGAYEEATKDFVDPENEILVLAEGGLGAPDNFKRLQDFQFELQLTDGVDAVYSPFALRGPPDPSGDAPLLISDAPAGLTPDLAERVRTHPILGAKLLSPDSKAMLFIVTPSEPKAPLSATRQIKESIETIAADLFAGGGITVTVTGFSAIRAAIVDILRRDLIVLNVAGALVGFIMSLIVFRSIAAAVIVAIPAILGGFTVVGLMGLFGMPVTVMTNVVPAVVMILGYADGMHLSFSWRHHRDAGVGVADAERLALQEMGGACMLAAITTAVAFSSLTISQVTMVRNFGIVGAIGTIGGIIVVLVVHALVTLAAGRLWKSGAGPTRNFLTALERPSAAIGRVSVHFARSIGVLAMVALVVLGATHFSVPADHSVREHLPSNNPTNAALGRIDEQFNGVFPVQIIVPLAGATATSAEGLDRVGIVHRAVEAVDGVTAPLSLWSLVQWLDGGADAATGAQIDEVLDQLAPATRSRFVGSADDALITVSVQDTPNYQAERLIDAIESAVAATDVDDVQVTGATVVNTRESSRTIGNLNISLTLSVVANLGVIAFAFRSIPVGILSFLPNILPIFAVGTLLFLIGRGMQFTSVIALTVAFGIAVDDTLHFINRYLLLGETIPSFKDRLVETSRRIGPVLLGTTLVIVAGLSTTLTSGLPTAALFGWIAAMTLVVALVGDMVILPALMAGYGRRWFAGKSAVAAKPGEVAA